MVETRSNLLDTAAKLAAKVGHVFITTSDKEGWPHVAAARTFKTGKNSEVTVSEWFCPGTMSNLQENGRVAIIVWEAKRDIGYQLLGKVAQVKDIAVMDGYIPKMKIEPPMPQEERQLIINVSKVTDFKRAPHTDTEE